jgi:glycosyltransferase involved in cell wall biosynthesis
MKKLLLLTDGIAPYVIGGMQKHSTNVICFLAKRGWHITVVHCVQHGKPLPSTPEVKAALQLDDAASVESIALHFPAPGFLPGHYLKESYHYSCSVFNQVKDRLSEFDFVYAKGFSAWNLLERKQKGLKCPPVAVKFHGYEMFQPAYSIKTRLEHWLLAGPVKWNTLHADFVFSYGGKITTLVRKLGVPVERILEVPSGIEQSWVRQSAQRTTGAVKALFLGRYERRKGIVELHQVLKELPHSLNFEFHFIGPIPMGDRLSDKRLIYHGELKEKEAIRQLLDQCQLLVAPSHAEGMPNVILEGMARGCAIVATPVGAVPLLVNDSNGWLVEAGNASALRGLLAQIFSSNGDELFNKGQQGLHKVNAEFTWEKVAETLEKKILQST